ncbi:MAG: hypothetical protein ACNS60_01945 [Candidatus Cyclobacteriaceae bacterium M2_1C_046]
MKKIAVPLTAILAVVSMVIGIFAGYNRLGWSDLHTGVGGEHGALMIGSFLGTVILLERVVTAKQRFFLLFPIINGISLPLFLTGFHESAIICLTIGAFSLCYIYLDILSRIKETSFYVMLAGAVCWLIGNILVIRYNLYPMALPWWLSFLLLTIVGERLELTKFLPVSKLQKQLLLLLLTVAVVALGIFFHKNGQLIGGIAIVGIVIWLFRHDMVRKSVFKEGLHRYSSIMLGLGYIWLGIYGLLLIVGGYADVSYDTLVHVFFIGFVMNMIFAHAPIILPGVAKFNFYPYHPALYISGILLQVSLLIRVMGNIGGLYELKYYGGILNGIFIFTFFISMVILVVSKLTESKKIQNKKVNNIIVELAEK